MKCAQTGLLVAVLVHLAACGGGPTTFGPTLPDFPPVDPDPDPDLDPDPSAFETSEYHAGGGLAMINASAMYARGGTGEGETVAVVDSGASPDHPDLAGAYTGVVCTGPEPHRANCGRDPAGHGTHVAGIVGARRNGIEVHGVAFDADIVSYDYLATRALDQDTTPVFADIRSRGIKIVNNSWGDQSCIGWGQLFGDDEACTYDTVRAALDGISGAHNVHTVFGALKEILNDELGELVLKDGGIMVWAAGNDGKYTTSPAVNAALPSVVELFASVY